MYLVPFTDSLQRVTENNSVVGGGDIGAAYFDRVNVDCQPEAASGAALQGASGTPGAGPASTA